MAAVNDAGLSQINHVITTHYHGDHVGGLRARDADFRIKEFINHGGNVQPSPESIRYLGNIAELAGKAKHVAKTGTRITVTGLDWRIVSATRTNSEDDAALRRCAQSILCGLQATRREPGVGRTARQHGGRTIRRQPRHIRKIWVLYLADFDWNQEVELMCPHNRIGTIGDLFGVAAPGNPLNSERSCTPFGRG